MKTILMQIIPLYSDSFQLPLVIVAFNPHEFVVDEAHYFPLLLGRVLLTVEVGIQLAHVLAASFFHSDVASHRSLQRLAIVQTLKKLMASHDFLQSLLGLSNIKITGRFREPPSR
jgi:hypothetical protein